MTLPDGKGLDRMEWERGVSYGWRKPNDPVKGWGPSHENGREYGAFWRNAKDAARAKGWMVAGGAK